MNDQKLQSFIDLVTFDQNLIQLEHSVDISKDKINQLHKDLDNLQNILDVKQSEKKELKKQLDLQELTVKDLQDKEALQTNMLKNVTNTKEQDAAYKQLEHVKIERDKQEQRLMKLWNMHEAIEKEVLVAQQKHNAKNAEIQEKITKEQGIMQSYKHNLDNLQKQRTNKLAIVPDEWLRLYENMRGKVTDPVVSVQQDSCSACFYSISSRDLQTLKQSDIIQCKDCYRFLYYKNEADVK